MYYVHVVQIRVLIPPDMEETGFYKTLVPLYVLHGITFQKTIILFVFT